MSGLIIRQFNPYQEPNASGVDGLRVVEITVAYVESAKTGRTVRIERAKA